MPTVTPKIQQAQITFFNYLFGKQEGFLCLATGNPAFPKSHKDHFDQYFFQWPEQREDIERFLEVDSVRMNVWFCTSLLEQQRRKKQDCLPGNIIWADLDSFNPKDILPVPSLAIKSSDYNYQAIWRVDTQLEPYQQEDFSKRLAYKYRANGVDPTGWDLTQLLRVPFTHNYKYDSAPQVDILHALDTLIPVELFEAIEVPEDYRANSTALAAASFPPLDLLPDISQITYAYQAQITGTPFKILFATIPGSDENWSGILWKFLNLCFEMGMDEFEVFALARECGCNKYRRDGRPEVHLWEDVLRALEMQRKSNLIFGSNDVLAMPTICNESLTDVRCFVDDYSEWALEATDAVPVYHDLCAFMALSTVMAGGLLLETDFGRVIPNLWGLVLGDSTLTRKTTAMNMAMDMVIDVDRELILATDGTAEGMLTGLSERPGRVSVFLRDEVTGFFESINQKQYLAGMMQTMTQLYDVPKLLSRKLSKSTITVNNPVFIFFGGGISEKTFSLVDEHYVISGFLPRFLVVNGEADLTKLRRIGRANSDLSSRKAALQMRIADMYERNNRTVTVKLGDSEFDMPKHIKVDLTDDAYLRYGDIEAAMLHAAQTSSVSMMALPTFERLSRSLLKMSILIAGSANDKPTTGNDTLLVEEKHVAKAAYYVQRWGNYTVDLILNSGKGSSEKILMKVLHTIEKYPNILRGQIMRTHALSSREANDILTTLEDRGHISIVKVGKGSRLKAL